MAAIVEDRRMEQTKKTSSSVFRHSLVTANSDALKFEAAASLQLRSTRDYRNSAAIDNRLIVSPYNDPLQLLDLTTLDIPNRLLAKALTALKSVRSDYATAEYTESFNWPVVLDLLRELAAAENYQWRKQSFYVVAFRSRLFPTVDSGRLHDLDFHSLAEATGSGGLLKYWFGTQDGKFQNLATCIWRNREDARRGGAGPWHKKARITASQLYASIEFTTLRWTIADGADEWEMVPWDEKDN